MNGLLDMLSPGFAERLLAVLLHTLWQAACAAGVLYLLLRRLPASRARARYTLSLLGLATVVLGAPATWAVLGLPAYALQTPTPTPAAPLVPGHGDASPSRGSADAAQAPTARVRSGASWARRAAGVWLAGVLLMLARAGLAVGGAGRLRSQCRPIEHGPAARMAESLGRALRVAGRVRVLVGEHVRVPCALGVIWPAVLLPAAMLSGMSADQLRLVLAHELAHIRRWDYLVNLVQMLIESLLFFNPAVWWLSRQARIEREACCDAAAVRATGEPVAYAHALSAWASHVRGLGAPAFGGPSRPGRLADRVSRIVLGDYHPRLRLPWRSLVGGLSLGAVLLATAWLGAAAAVGTAARWLTPKERIERVAEIQRTDGPPARHVHGDADRITVSGTVRTEDGAELPHGLRLAATVRYAGGIEELSVGVTDGRFSKALRSGKVYLAARAKGYAFTFVGPLRPEPGGAAPGIEILLRRGFVGRLRIEDEAGRPVRGARMHGYFPMGPMIVGQFDSVADKQGVVSVARCVGHPLQLTVRADGFQFDRRLITLEPDTVTSWRLAPAAPTTGVVTSQQTGPPVAGAELRLVRQTGFWDRVWRASKAATWARTDKHGRFVLSSLRDDSSYAFLVDAPRHRLQFIENVRAGQTGRTVRLGSELVVRGKVVGLASLGKRAVPRRVCYWRHFGGASYEESVPLVVRDGVGSFAITRLWLGNLHVRVHGTHVRAINLSKSIDDLVIDMSEPPPPRPTPSEALAELVIRFAVPADSPPPRGTIRAAYRPVRWVTAPVIKTHAIVDGEVKLRAATPGHVTLEAAGMVGYWFGQESRRRAVPAGPGPHVITVPVVPAGAVHGAVFNADGSPAAGEGLFASVIVVKKAKSMPSNSLGLGGGAGRTNRERGTFAATPLPLGGAYRIVAHRRQSYVVSEPITLDEARPTRRVTLTLPRGRLVSGTVHTPDGRPAPGVEVQFHYSTPWNSGFGPARGIYTGRLGRFRFEHVNPDAPGRYELVLPMRRDYRPMRVAVTPGAGPVAIRLERGAVLTGTVVDAATGRPMAGREVCAISADPVRWREPTGSLEAEAATDDHGRFRFSTLARRTYQLLVRGGGRHARCEATGGQAEPVTIRVSARRR